MKIAIDREARRFFFLRAMLALLVVTGLSRGQIHAVGDTVESFSLPYCANEKGEFSLSDLDGDVNGGNYSVIWLVFFASW